MRTTLHSVEYEAYRVPFRLTADSADLLAEMLQCVPWSAMVRAEAKDGPSDADEFALECRSEQYRLIRGGVATSEAMGLQIALEQLTRELMVYVGDNAPDRVFVHAGVIVWSDRALLLPGTSFAGKSTLVEALVRAGATYYSDEYAVLDATGCVYPYARVLQMRDPGSEQQRTVKLREADGRVVVGASPVSRVVFAHYVERATWNPALVSRGNAVLAMMKHAIAVQRAPARVMATLATMMENAVAVRSERGEADLTAAIILAMMAADNHT